jgi:hypothetical protein
LALPELLRENLAVPRLLGLLEGAREPRMLTPHNAVLGRHSVPRRRLPWSARHHAISPSLN